MGIWKDMIARGTATMQAHTLAQRFVTAMATNRRPAELMMLPADWNPAKVAPQTLLEIKYDGIAAGYSQPRNAAGYAFTREGVVFNACSHILPSLAKLDMTLGGDYVIFGEYIHMDGFNAALSDFGRGIGTGLIVVFDAVHRDVWEGRVPSPPLHQRKRALDIAYALLFDDEKMVLKLAKYSLFEGPALDSLELVAGEMWANGEEGIVVKDANSPFERRKSDAWMKIKQQNTVDLPITGMTIKDGRLSSITVEATPGISSKVGVGFSESDRANPLRFVTGRMVELKHLGLTEKGALKSASFLRFRDDKTGGK